MRVSKIFLFSVFVLLSGCSFSSSQDDGVSPTLVPSYSPTEEVSSLPSPSLDPSPSPSLAETLSPEPSILPQEARTPAPQNPPSTLYEAEMEDYQQKLKEKIEAEMGR